MTKEITTRQGRQGSTEVGTGTMHVEAMNPKTGWWLSRWFFDEITVVHEGYCDYPRVCG